VVPQANLNVPPYCGSFELGVGVAVVVGWVVGVTAVGVVVGDVVGVVVGVAVGLAHADRNSAMMVSKVIAKIRYLFTLAPPY
jgi:hypothetical protein